MIFVAATNIEVTTTDHIGRCRAYACVCVYVLMCAVNVKICLSFANSIYTYMKNQL